MKFQQQILYWMLHTKRFLVVLLVFIIILAYVSNRHMLSLDLTQNSRNSLSNQTEAVLKNMPEPIDVTVFASKDDVTNGDKFRQSMIDFVARYQRIKQNITLNIFSVSENPALARDENIKIDGEMVVKYQQQSMHFYPPLNEEVFTNLLFKLSRAENRHIASFGHDNTQSGSGYAELRRIFIKQGFHLEKTSTQVNDLKPENFSTIILSPSYSFHANESTNVEALLDLGKNFLCVVDDNSHKRLSGVFSRLGLSVSSQTLSQHITSKALDSDQGVYANYYAQHAITQEFSLQTIFKSPHELVGRPSVEQGWKMTPIVLVATNADGQESAKDDQSITKSLLPYHVVLAYERQLKGKVQRVVIVGDPHFLGSQSMSKVGNKALLFNILKWLASDDIKIPIKPVLLKDVNMIVPEHSVLPKIIGYAVQYTIPAVLIFLTFYVMHRRRKL